MRRALILVLLLAASPAAARPPRSAPATRLPAAARVIAIGDVHGDLAALRGALRLAGVIDAKDAWIGGRTVVVQLGDQLDRGDDEPEILALSERLVREAEVSGGAFHPLIGNHEAMNVAGDMRYVTEDGLRDYAEEGVPPQEARRRAFAPGRPLARLLAARNVVQIVGDTLFVHGGVLPEHVDYGLERINREAQAWMRGDQEAPPWMRAADGPLWSRHYSDGEADCARLGRALARAEVKRMVVAHTVQARGVNSACDGRVWRVDVGLSRHYGGAPQILELSGDGARPRPERR